MLEAHDNTITTRIGISTKFTQEVSIYENTLSTALFDPSDNMEVGILINQADAAVSIDGNAINNFTEYGIFVLDAKASDGTYDIINNSITSDYDDSPQYDLTGINIDNSATFTPVTKPFIFSNTINDVQRGIYLMDQPSIVEGNIINFKKPSGSTKPAAGIVNITGDASNITGNTINGNCTSCTDLDVRGIQNYDATHVFLIENHISDCGFGILLNESVWEGAPYCNEFYDCDIGIGLDELVENPTAPDQYYGIGGVVGSDITPVDNKWFPESTAIRTTTGFGPGATLGSDIMWYYRTAPFEFSMPLVLNEGTDIVAAVASTSPGTIGCSESVTSYATNSLPEFQNGTSALNFVIRAFHSSRLATMFDSSFQEELSSFIQLVTTFSRDDYSATNAILSAYVCRITEECEIVSQCRGLLSLDQYYADSVYIFDFYHDDVLRSSGSSQKDFAIKSNRMQARYGLNYDIPQLNSFNTITHKETIDFDCQPEFSVLVSLDGDILHLQCPDEIHNIMILDLNGRLVFTQTLSAQSASYNVSRLISGMYIIKVCAGANVHTTKVYME